MSSLFVCYEELLVDDSESDDDALDEEELCSSHEQTHTCHPAPSQIIKIVSSHDKQARQRKSRTCTREYLLPFLLFLLFTFLLLLFLLRHHACALALGFGCTRNQGTNPGSNLRCSKLFSTFFLRFFLLFFCFPSLRTSASRKASSFFLQRKQNFESGT